MKFGDLFSGGGFGARGAVKGGGEPVLAIDSWGIAVDTYAQNFPNAEVVYSTVNDVNPQIYAKKYDLDVLVTSPECTSHSIARGKRPACEKSRETLIDIIPWVEAFQPHWLIVENVTRMKNWNRHNEFLNKIESIGYSVSNVRLNAADFGTAQSRTRMFLICSKDGHKITREALLKSHSRNIKPARSIVDWNADYKSGLLYKKGRAKATIDRAKRAIKALGKNVPFIIVYYGTDYAGGWQSLDAPLRTVTTIDRFGLVTWQNGDPYLRMLQPEELKCAMGAGKGHKLSFGSRRDKVKLCGNGICSPVMEVIFKKMKSLDKRTLEIAP